MGKKGGGEKKEIKGKNTVNNLGRVRRRGKTG